jgi:DNA polymerase (family 10)
MSRSKDEIADELDKYADFLEIDGQTGRAHAYDKAARAVRRANWLPANPARLDGIGQSTREAVIDIENGVGIDELDDLEAAYDWYAAMRDVKHIGPARARELHEKLGIDSLAKLEMVARNGDLTLISGVGPKTASKIRDSIEKQR